MRLQALMFFTGDKLRKIIGVFAGFRILAIHGHFEVVALTRPDDRVVAFRLLVRRLVFEGDGIDRTRFCAVEAGRFCISPCKGCDFVCAIADAVMVTVERNYTCGFC